MHARIASSCASFILYYICDIYEASCSNERERDTSVPVRGVSLRDDALAVVGHLYTYTHVCDILLCTIKDAVRTTIIVM
jgi:hypothetical protein